MEILYSNLGNLTWQQLVMWAIGGLLIYLSRIHISRSFTKSPRNGTRMRYIGVMKPDFPTVVWMRPYCWITLAVHRIAPVSYTHLHKG